MAKYTNINSNSITIADSLVSTSITEALSAKQGKILNDKITNLDSSIGAISFDGLVVDTLANNNTDKTPSVRSIKLRDRKSVV